MDTIIDDILQICNEFEVKDATKEVILIIIGQIKEKKTFRDKLIEKLDMRNNTHIKFIFMQNDDNIAYNEYTFSSGIVKTFLEIIDDNNRDYHIIGISEIVDDLDKLDDLYNMGEVKHFVSIELPQ